MKSSSSSYRQVDSQPIATVFMIELTPLPAGDGALIVGEAKENILQAVDRVIRAILGYIAAEETGDSVFCIVSRGIDKLTGEFNHKVRELLDPHTVPVLNARAIATQPPMKSTDSSIRWVSFYST
jgi:hypothetical protein